MNETVTLSSNLTSNFTSVDSSIVAVNATNLSTATNDVFFRNLESWTGFNLADSLQYYMIMFVAFLILWIAVRNMEWRSGSKILFAASPFILCEALITEFGAYTLYLPFGNEIFINRFVHIFELLDYVFHFGLFSYFASPIVAQYTATIVETEPTGMLYVIVAILSFGDTVFQILFLTFGMYSVLTLIENKFNFQFPAQSLIAFVLGCIPSIYTAITYSNPIHEFEQSKSLVMRGIYFFKETTSAGAYTDLVIVFTVLLISMMLIYYILGIVVDLLLSTYININPKGKEIDYSVSISSVTSMIVLMYSVVFILHPEYWWYKILSVLLFLTLFKKFMDSIIAKAKYENKHRRDQQAFAQLVASNISGNNQVYAGGNIMNKQRQQTMDNKTNKNKRLINFWIPLIVAIVFIVIGLFYMFT